MAKYKLSIAANQLGQISNLLGENSAAGKAAAIASATINSYLAFTDVLKTPTTLPEPFGSIQKIISAGTVLASGIATVKNIVSVKTPPSKKGGGGAGRGAIPSATAAPAPPSFNIVGASETNQLAQVIGGQEQQPVKAFVVSNEVTNAQALDRNIVNSASLG